MYDFLWLHGLQYSRLPCPSPTPGAYSNSCQLSRWCHPTISSSVIPFSSHFQSFPATGAVQMSQFFSSSGQSIGVSASASVLPMDIQDWFPLVWTGWISLKSKGLGNNDPICETAKDFWTLWEKMRVGWFERIALEYVYYHMWNRLPVQVQCMRQGAQGWCTGMTLRDGMGREMGGGSGWGTHVHPWLIHVNVWQKSITILLSN